MTEPLQQIKCEKEKRIRTKEFKQLLRERLEEAERRSKESAIVRHAVKPENSVRRQLDRSPSEAKQIVLSADPIVKQARADTVLNRFRRECEKFVRYSLLLPLDEVNQMLRQAAEKDFGREVADGHFRDGRLHLVTDEERQRMTPLPAHQLTDEMFYNYFVWSNDVERKLIDKTRYTEMEWPAELGIGAAYNEIPGPAEAAAAADEFEKRRRKFYSLFYMLRDMKRGRALITIVRDVRESSVTEQPENDREHKYRISKETALHKYQVKIAQRINQSAMLRVMDDLVANYSLLRQLHEFSGDI